MRVTSLGAMIVGVFALAVPAGPTASAGDSAPALAGVGSLTSKLGRQTLRPNDGWAASGSGTTGGSAAAPDHVYQVSTRTELVNALGGDNASNRTNGTPKIIVVAGTIDGFESPDGSLLTCADLADPDYSLQQYLAAYDPAVWGRVAPSGALEEARVRSVANQTRQTQINVGPNTTIIGTRGATLAHLTLMLDGANNNIVRNLRFTDAYDCFPAWSPTDGDLGNWNSQFDTMSVRRASNVWVDHNTFSDGDNPDSNLPTYFGRPFQWHDGLLDITHTSSLVTVSYNVFTNHDKVMLIGSSNTVGPDVGRLNVTLHHNLFDGNIQRLPRVRFGQVDVYNNYYRLAGDAFDYAWGVGVQSAMYAENNFFALDAGVAAEDLVHDWGGTVITEKGTWVRPDGGRSTATSVLNAYNTSHDPDLGGDAGWTPTLRAGPMLPTPLVPLAVRLLAGADRLLI